ncbi:MAG: hypothetical protein Ct9H90mP7_3470 [Candidatus Neomarinimicrobiota bacterium]|nr:MAG: hypothetical protein Ct9H90mP7_3470 [Candidatus Neomarinimicrobiota bacterium]
MSREILIASVTSSVVISRFLPISSSLGDLSTSASSFSAVFVIFEIVPTLFKGSEQYENAQLVLAK